MTTGPAPAKTAVASTALTAAASTNSLTLPSALTDGQLLILYVNWNSDTTTLDSFSGGSGATWNQIYKTNTGAGNLQGAAYWRNATAATDSSAVITLHFSANASSVIGCEVWPVSTLVDSSATQNNASSTTESFTSVTPTSNGADYTIIGCAHLRRTASGTITSSPGGSYTEQVDLSNNVSGTGNQAIETKYLQLTGGGGSAQTPTSGSASNAATQIAATIAIRAIVTSTVDGSKALTWAVSTDGTTTRSADGSKALTWAVSTDGTTTRVADGSKALTWATTSDAAVTRTATASPAYTWAATAAASLVSAATATTALSFAVSADATIASPITATTTALSFAVSADAQVVRSAEAMTATTFAVSTAATVVRTATASAVATTFTVSAAIDRSITATATVAATFAVSAAIEAVHPAAAQVDVAFTVVADVYQFTSATLPITIVAAMAFTAVEQTYFASDVVEPEVEVLWPPATDPRTLFRFGTVDPPGVLAPETVVLP